MPQGRPETRAPPRGAATRAAAQRGGKWAAMGKCSADTALRDIHDLLERGVLARLEGGGWSTGYLLVKQGPTAYAVSGSSY